MQPHRTISPLVTDDPSADTLSALADAATRLSGISVRHTDAERRLLRRIGVYRAQLERLNRWWVRSCPDADFAKANCVVRLAELTESLTELQARQREAYRLDLRAAQDSVTEARRAARVDHVLADQFRRSGDHLRMVV